MTNASAPAGEPELQELISPAERSKRHGRSVRLPGIGWAMAIGAGACLAFILWLGYQHSQLVRQTLNLQPSRLAIWDVAQLQRQLLRLEGKVLSATAAGQVDDPEGARLAMELVLSRVQVLSEGASARALQTMPAHYDVTPRLFGLVRVIHSGYEEFLAHPSTAGPKLAAQIGEAVALSQEYFSLIYTDQTTRAGRTVESLARIQDSMAALALGFVALTTLWIGILWITLRSRLRAVSAIAQEREASEHRLQHLMDVSIQGILVHRDFHPLYVNDAMAHIMGFRDRTELLEQADRPNIGVLVLPEDVERIRAMHEDRMRGAPVPERFEMRLRARGGAIRWVDFSVKRIEWQGDFASLATCVDITERKRAEEELREAKEASESANRAKSRFLASMSHELRTPLTSMMGYAQLILKNVYGGVAPEVKAAVLAIHDSGQHLLELINDVLDISRIEAGRMALNCTDSSPATCIEGVIWRLRPLAEEKGLALVAQTADAPEKWSFDNQRVMQVLVNLVGNAIKFSDEGSVRIGAKTHEGELMFWVADTGVGIHPGQMPTLFAEFQQADSHVGRKAPGSGLGLAIVKRLVELHGGRVWAESTPNHGSKFTFVLPGRPQ